MVQAGCILWILTVCDLTSCGPSWRDLFKGSSKFLIFRCRSNIKPILEQEEKMLDSEMRSLSWFQHCFTSQQCGHRRLSTKSYCIILYQCHLIILLIRSMRDNFKRISVSAFVQMPKKNKRWPWNTLKVMVRDSGQVRKKCFLSTFSMKSYILGIIDYFLKKIIVRGLCYVWVWCICIQWAEFIYYSVSK